MFYIISIISLLQIAFFAGIFNYFYTSPLFFCSCRKFYLSFPLAKTSGWLININLFLLLICQIKLIKKKFFIPFSIKILHYCTIVYLYIWCIVHVISHYINFSKLIASNKISLSQLLSWGVGYTGHFLIICFILFFVFSLPYFRKNKYHIFMTMHYVLLILVVVFTIIHGSFCFFKPDPKSGIKCFLPTTWLWVSIPFVIYCVEIFIKYSKKHKIYNVKRYSNDIFEIELKLSPKYYGKTVNICCPAISLIEWHPFAVTNNSICIKIRGNWTTKFAKLLGILPDSVISTVYPFILIDGPFHCTPKNINQIISNKTCVFIASGIGLTSFYQLFHNLSENITIKNTHILIICQKFKDIEFCIEILNIINNIPNVNLHLFFTSETYHCENLSLSYSFGRPHFESIFSTVNIIHDPSDPAYVFFSGKNSIYKSLKIYKNKYISNAKLYKL